MLKPDNKQNGKVLDPVLTEGITQGSADSGQKNTNIGHATKRAGNEVSVDTRTTDKATTGGKVQKQKSLALVTRTEQLHEIKRQVTSPFGPDSPVTTSKTYFKEATFLVAHANSIPISGYTAFQQMDFSKVHFDFNQCLLQEKVEVDPLKAQPTRIHQGSTNKGPFPFYEEIPLINILTALLIEKYSDDYIPTANTNTNLPLTVSP